MRPQNQGQTATVDDEYLLVHPAFGRQMLPNAGGDEAQADPPFNRPQMQFAFAINDAKVSL